MSNPLTPLPPHLQSQILSHLLPPQFPLPPNLLSQSLLNRHLYLPPKPSEPDTYISPFPFKTSPSNIISTLKALSSGHQCSTTKYAFNGENILAKCHIGSDRFGLEEVVVIFEYEVQAPSVLLGVGGLPRSWVYFATLQGDHEFHYDLLWGGFDMLESTIRRELGRLDVDEEEGVEVNDYWAGFTPPSKPVEIDDEIPIVGEEDYWAQYDQGPPVNHLAGPNDPYTKVLGDTDNLKNSQGDGIDESTNNTLNHLFEELSDALPPPTQPPTLHRNDHHLRPKLIKNIFNQLKTIWKAFISANGRLLSEEEIEEKALEWLRICRKIVYPSFDPGIEVDREQAILESKISVLVNVYAVFENDVQGDPGDTEGEGGFWRLIEEAIRIDEPDEEVSRDRRI